MTLNNGPLMRVSNTEDGRISVLCNTSVKVYMICICMYCMCVSIIHTCLVTYSGSFC